jgi:uncharacterized membrane protein
MKKSLLLAMSVLAVSLTMADVALSPVQAATKVTVYSVTGVTPGQFLNARSGPGTNNPVQFRIPANGTGVVATGEETKVGSSVWAKVYWAGKGGWVSKTYLTAKSIPAPPPPGNKPPSPPPGSASNGIVMRCGGTEPFWGITITERDMNVDVLDGPRYSVPVTFRQTSANDRTIAVIAGQNGPNETQTFLQKVSACSDGMSDVNYPYAVTAVFNKQRVYSGCCRVTP